MLFIDNPCAKQKNGVEHVSVFDAPPEVPQGVGLGYVDGQKQGNALPQRIRNAEFLNRLHEVHLCPI